MDSSLLIKDNQVQINIPISKSNVDKENRIVSGWATIDNVDQMGDVVTAEASIRAFESFRGNIREMHDKFKAVGKLVKFRQAEFIDPSTGKIHSGIWVDVYISKGAEDTWQKVLDGTLTGFSVYGPIDSEGIVKQYVPDEDRMVRYINKYSLIELSLVDNPGNELCNVLEIVKSADPQGIATEVEIENVYWCPADEKAFVSKSESYDCAFCKTELEPIGWFESTENPGQEVLKILKSKELISKNNVTEGGQEMPDNDNQEVTEVTETEETVEATEEAPVEDATEVEAVEEVAEEDEVKEVSEPDLVDIAKALDDIQKTLAQSTETEQEREAQLTKVRETVEGVEAKVEKQLSDLLQRQEKLDTDFKSFKEGLDTVEKRLETIEGSTALRKSADVEDEDEALRKGADGSKSKSVWSNKFLPTSFDQ